MHKRGMFSDKRGIASDLQMIGYLLAGIAVAFVILEFGKLAGSGDLIRSQAMAKDVAMTVDSLMIPSYPMSALYPTQMFTTTQKVELNSESATMYSEEKISGLYYFIPDLRIDVLKSEYPLVQDFVNLVPITRNARSIELGGSLSQARFCPGNSLPIKDPVIVVIVPDQDLRPILAGFFGASKQGWRFEADEKNLDTIKPNFVIVVRKQGQEDPHVTISFKTTLSDSRRIACLMANVMAGVLQKETVPIIPGRDAVLDSITNYPSAMIIVPESTQPKTIADSLSPITESLVN